MQACADVAPKSVEYVPAPQLKHDFASVENDPGVQVSIVVVVVVEVGVVVGGVVVVGVVVVGVVVAGVVVVGVVVVGVVVVGVVVVIVGRVVVVGGVGHSPAAEQLLESRKHVCPAAAKTMASEYTNLSPFEQMDTEKLDPAPIVMMIGT